MTDFHFILGRCHPGFFNIFTRTIALKLFYSCQWGTWEYFHLMDYLVPTKMYVHIIVVIKAADILCWNREMTGWHNRKFFVKKERIFSLNKSLDEILVFDFHINFDIIETGKEEKIFFLLTFLTFSTWKQFFPLSF
jgi:hypothetical protein